MSIPPRHRGNYLISAIRTGMLLLALTILFSLLVSLFPNSFGELRANYELDTVYFFQDWSFTMRGMEIEFPQGGFYVPVRRNGRDHTLVIFGNGSYRFTPPGDDNKEITEPRLTAALIAMHPDDIDNLTHDMFYERATNPEHLEKAERIVAQNRVNLFQLEIFGTKRIFPPDKGYTGITLYGDEYGRARFSINGNLKFIREDGTRVTAPIHTYYGSYPPTSLLFRTVLFILLGGFCLLLLEYLLTIDFDAEWLWGTARQKVKKVENIWCLIAIAVTALGAMLMREIGISTTGVVGLYILALLLTLLAIPARPDMYMGFVSENLPRGIAVAVVAGVLAVLVGALRLPVGVNAVTAGQILDSLVLTALFPAVLLFGFLQTAISDRIGPRFAAALIPLLFALPSLIAAQFSGGGFTSSHLISSLIVTPLTAGLGSYLFYRTRSLPGAVVLFFVLDIMAMVVAFS